ncbi:DNA-binding GntR family transcriptional regulator [Humitalea rosea]|uniref:DNA-binding GntR family transcriptional regulator n=1 Tax=Humitalea rosea TaxID=990373 RepID=A0A2W7IFZ2_9PROT|nr:GntR family transcriptional regulator [Humitalea rosea]PZW37683.1 DNA-binding GntR family transcriptional regulator [Humitalea rosea]
MVEATMDRDSAAVAGEGMVGRIRRQIEAMIIDGRLASGEHLVESALAQRFGTSRGMIREACRGLVEAGLLVTFPNRGVFVREISLRDAVELYDVRAALARLAGETLAARITPPQLAELQAMIDAMGAACDAMDLEAFQRVNAAFHDRIIALSGNRRLQLIQDALAKELSILRRRGIMGSGDIRSANAEHRGIHAALAQGDAEEAGRRLERHIHHSKLRFLEAMSRAAP